MRKKRMYVLCDFGVILLSICFLSDSLARSGDTECAAKFDSITGNEVYIFVDQRPEFPGGIDSLQSFIKKNLKYPKQCIEGKVIVSFVVLVDGSLSGFSVLKGITKDANREALAVVRKMPDWNPGRCNGKPVPVRLPLAVAFRL